MNSTLVLDLEGLDSNVLLTMIAELSESFPELEVQESRCGTEIAIDAETVNMLAGVISAVCAVITLVAMLSQRKKNGVSDETVDCVMLEVERRFHTELSVEIKEGLRNLDSSDISASRFTLDAQSSRYVLNVYRERSCTLVKGRTTRRSR